MSPKSSPATAAESYAQRLRQLESVWWKRLLDVQAPYRWHLKRLNLGFTLDLGCGIGRNLRHLDGYGVGVDHNASAVAEARARGLTAYLPEDFTKSAASNGWQFDTVLLAHVAEHMTVDDCCVLLKQYLSYLKSGGRVVIITPQEAGQRSDATHVTFMDFIKLRDIALILGLEVLSEYSFPFARMVGHTFKYNEFVVIYR